MPFIMGIVAAMKTLVDKYVFVGNTTSSPYASAYPWSTTGFGAKYADPATLPLGANGATFSPKSDFLFLASAGGTNKLIYPWAFSDSGWGTAYAKPASTPVGNAQAVAMSANGAYIGAPHSSTSPFVAVYTWSNGFGSKFADPASTNFSTSQTGFGFSPDNASVIISGPNGGPNPASAYPWSSGGFGTKFANPATNFSAQIYGIARWDKTGTTLLKNGGYSDSVEAYAWSSTSGLGSKYAAPATIGTLNQYATVHPNGNAVVAASNNNSPAMQAWAWNGIGWGSKFSDPASGPAGTPSNIDFSRSGQAVGLSITGSPYVNVWAWSSTGFGSKFANPASLPPNIGSSIAFG